MKSHLPACFVWAFLPKIRSVTVPYSQSHSHSEWTHQSISWKSELPDTPATQVRHTNVFLFVFCLCKRPCLFPPKHKSQPPARWQREQATKRCHPMVSPGLPLTQRWGTTGHLLQELPLTGGKDGTHTHPALPSRLPAHIAQITPKSSKALHTRGSLNKWFSEGKSLGAKQRLW